MLLLPCKLVLIIVLFIFKVSDYRITNVQFQKQGSNAQGASYLRTKHLKSSADPYNKGVQAE